MAQIFTKLQAGLMRFSLFIIKAILLCLVPFYAPSGIAGQQDSAIKMGVITLASPTKTFQQWQPFTEYLSKKLNRKVEIVVPKGFRKIKQSVVNKSVDIFFVNSFIFYQLKQQGKAEALVQMMNIDDSVLSRSVLFVRSDSGIESIKELKGEKVAFVSPVGAGGYLAPRASFYKAGIKTQTQTDEEFTGNLTSTLHKVILGDVKVGTMCSINYKLMGQRINAGELKVIAESEKYPEALFGARSDLSSELKKNIAKIMLNMHKDEEGKKILEPLKALKIKKFVAYDTAIEKFTRELIKTSEFSIQ